MASETESNASARRRLGSTGGPAHVAIAAAVTVAIVGAVLLALEAVSVPLGAGETLREPAGSVIAGGEPVYNAADGYWLAVRGLLGAYIVFVALLISALALAVWKEVLD